MKAPTILPGVKQPDTMRQHAARRELDRVQLRLKFLERKFLRTRAGSNARKKLIVEAHRLTQLSQLLNGAIAGGDPPKIQGRAPNRREQRALDVIVH